jgi:hypothetical protein
MDDSMKTLLLDQVAWDLVLNASGNIALASNPYSLSQDVASAIRTFKGECWFNVELGIPHFQDILGQWPPLELVKAYVERAAKTVPGVDSATCVFVSLEDRELRGRVEITTAAGQQTVEF